MGDAEERLEKLKRLAELQEQAARVERAAESPGLTHVKAMGYGVVAGCWERLPVEYRAVLSDEDRAELEEIWARSAAGRAARELEWDGRG